MQENLCLLFQIFSQVCRSFQCHLKMSYLCIGFRNSTPVRMNTQHAESANITRRVCQHNTLSLPTQHAEFASTPQYMNRDTQRRIPIPLEIDILETVPDSSDYNSEHKADKQVTKRIAANGKRRRSSTGLSKERNSLMIKRISLRRICTLIGDLELVMVPEC